MTAVDIGTPTVSRTFTGSGTLVEKSSIYDEKKKSSFPVDGGSSADSLPVTSIRGMSPVCPPYRLYRRRWLGLSAIVTFQMVASMAWPWFGPISGDAVDQLGFSLNQISWFGNAITVAHLVVAFVTPCLTSRLGIRKTCYLAAFSLLLSAWLRYAGTAPGLSKYASFWLIVIGQFFAGLTQLVFQIIAPRFSELWFDIKTRTTATGLVSIGGVIGGAMSQLIAPACKSVKMSILVLGIMSTAVTPLVFLIEERPPTPPTHAGSKPPLSTSSLLRAMLGREPLNSEAYMTSRERLDYLLLLLTFAIFHAATSTFAVMSGQWLSPEGYSDGVAGYMGATLAICGIVMSLAVTPLFDRLFAKHLAWTVRLLCPVIGGTWLAFIWAVRPHNAPALFVLLGLIGAYSVTLLPVGLELACELTRNAEGSSALIWFFANIFSIIFITSQVALRAPLSASPPQHMHRAIIFNGAWCLAAATLVFSFSGKQARRERDELMMQATQKAVGQEVA